MAIGQITNEQRETIAELGKNAVMAALATTRLNRLSAQCIIVEERTNLQNAITNATKSVFKEVADANPPKRKKRKTYGYFSGYRRSPSITDQIDILQGLWPQLNPDPALRYLHETYNRFRLPKWVEGAFALIRPWFFGNKYEEELAEVLRALAKKTRFQNNLEEQINDGCLRQKKQTTEKLRDFIERHQPDSDIIIVPGQFGMRHRGKSAQQTCRQSLLNKECGVGIKDTAIMLITNPERLANTKDLRILCLGDELRMFGLPGTPYSQTPEFRFDEEGHRKIYLDCHGCSYPKKESGSATFLLKTTKTSRLN